MQTEVVRKFNVLDAMVLVAASAVGLWLGRAINDRHVTQMWSVRRYEREIDMVRFAALAWTSSLLVLRFRPPRPRWRRLWRQPGLVGLSAVVVGGSMNAGWQLLWRASITLKSRLTIPLPDPLEFVHFMALWYPLARAVVVVWLILLVSGRWRAEPSWIDRLGRALGVFWIAWAALECIRPSWLLE